MSKNAVSATATIPAPAEKVFAVIADYERHHPRILPEAYFYGLEVLDGGVGAGTRIRVIANVMGSEQELEMSVSEPQPGNVLTETNADSGYKTTFAVLPKEADACEVTITTQWRASPGLRGLLERFFLPRYVRGMLDSELEQLAEYVAQAAV